MESFKEVTKEEFYEVINSKKLDVCVHVDSLTPFPYTTNFKFRNDVMWGKVVDAFKDGVKNKYPIVSTYYIKL